jgi:hypothetical protein
MAAKPKKRAKKSGANSGQFKKGEKDERRGNGPPKGSGGRPPIEIKQACQDLTYEEILPKIGDYLRLHKPENRGWCWCADWVGRYAGFEESGIAGLEIKVSRE